jgi:nucleoside-diphosphate-sugar epimerase
LRRMEDHMRVFVTGATGFIGSAIVSELVSAGHQVRGLVRSADKGKDLVARGVSVVEGSVDDHGLLTRSLEDAEAVIHTAFDHDFSRFAENCERDRRAVVAMGQALSGSERPLVLASAIGVLAGVPADGELSDESTAPNPSHPRVASERAAAEVAARGVRVSVVRLAPSVHGPGDPHFLGTLVKIAREKRLAAWVGQGQNRWAAVHRLDAAHLFCLAAARCPDGLNFFHAVDDEGVPLSQIASAIASHLGVPARALPAAEAAQHFGWLARFVGEDMASSSARTRAQLDWRPTQPSLLEDLARSY